jgi:LDH2 family malate/lactate/ureidoglycolate dehydrogenase
VSAPLTPTETSTPTSTAATVAVAALERFVLEVFRHAGMSDEDAALMTRSLVEADRNGLNTHGTARVAPYVSQLLSGQVNPAPHERVLIEQPSAVLIDADNAFGAPAGIRAMELAMAKAEATGVCIAGITNVAHFGAAGFYTRYAAERGFLALAMSSTSPSVVPFGGMTPRIGNSPMSFATPGVEHPELVMDMAQSMTSRGRIKVAQEKGETIPENWAIDRDGNPTVDPAEALAGAVLPSGGHKGSAMSLVVEMLASGLTGAHLSQDIHHAGFTTAAASGEAAQSPSAQNDVTVGNFYLVIDAGVFGAAGEVRERATRIADYVRSSPAAPGFGSVLAPGDIELRKSETADREGISLLPSTVKQFRELAERFGIAAPPMRDDGTSSTNSQNTSSTNSQNTDRNNTDSHSTDSKGAEE